jgi:hypothetical protein
VAKTGSSGEINPPEKNQHMRHFDTALKDALKKWQPSDGDEIEVVFHAFVSPNPGGIREYRVTIR